MVARHWSPPPIAAIVGRDQATEDCKRATGFAINRGWESSNRSIQGRNQAIESAIKHPEKFNGSGEKALECTGSGRKRKKGGGGNGNRAGEETGEGRGRKREKGTGGSGKRAGEETGKGRGRKREKGAGGSGKRARKEAGKGRGRKRGNG